MKKTLLSVACLVAALSIIPACRNKCTKETEYKVTVEEGHILPTVKKEHSLKI